MVKKIDSKKQKKTTETTSNDDGGYIVFPKPIGEVVRRKIDFRKELGHSFLKKK